MAGSAADTPTTPEYLRVSDVDRDRAVDDLKQEYVHGRLSHDTFMLRMHAALGARNQGQLSGLFTDLPHRRPAGRWAGSGRCSAGAGASRPRTRHQHAPADRRPAPGRSRPAPGPYRPGAGAPLSFPPGRDTSFTIGRDRDCDLFINDMTVSRLHARLARDDQGWVLTDLGSTNGTRLNGWRVRAAVPVRSGDLILFGSVAFVVQTGGIPFGVKRRNRLESGSVTTVLLVRHGLTAITGQVLSGWTPGISLDERGREQAQALAARLAPVPLDAIITSPLERCRETALAIAEGREGQAASADDRVGECQYGDWTGRPLAELAEEPLWRVVQAHPSAATFPGGRGVHAGHAAPRGGGGPRLERGLGADATYLICSHGDVIKAIVADSLGLHLDQCQRIHADPCSLTVIRYTPLRPFLIRMNDTGGGVHDLMRGTGRSQATPW